MRVPWRLSSEEVSRLADANVMAIGTFGGWKKLRSGTLLLASVTAAGVWAQDLSPQPDEPQTVTDASPFRLHVYSDVDFSHNQVAGEPNHFSVGEIDLFSTMAIAPKLTALAELVVDTDGTASLSSVSLNVERLLLQYRVNDYLKIEAGQYRTAIGYYSTAYLRGAWFQTAISRPRMFAFEEDGGVLPLHTVGVSTSGMIPSGALGLHYVAEVGNTRTWGSPAGTDVSGHDAVNFSLFARPRSIPGLEVGFSDYHDQYSFAGLNLDRGGITAHVVYVANRFELLNEGVVAHLSYAPANASATFSGFYSQLAYRVGPNWGPYVRVEKLSVQASPFFFALLPTVANWRSMYTAGVRYDWNDHVATKLELGHEADWGVPHYYQAALQVAFAF
jgi:hypothetical protein